MDIYVLDTSLKKIGVIDYCSSIIWTKKYCDAGDFELYLPVTTEALELLQENNLVMREDDRASLMVIKTIVLTTDAENGNYLTVSGPSVESYLGKRIIWEQTNLSGTIVDCATTLINQNIINPSISDRKIPKVALGESIEDTHTITKQITGDNLLTAITELLNTYRLGFSMDFNDTIVPSLLFKIYRGTNRSSAQSSNPRVIFSPYFDNLLATTIQASNVNYRNIAKVAGEGEGVNRTTYVVGVASGVDREEIYVDARDISSQVDGGTLTPSEYNGLLAQRGDEALAECVATQDFEGEIEPNTNFVYGVDYFLGDIVDLQNEYGISAIVRITAITESWDENGYKCIPTFNSKEV